MKKLIYLALFSVLFSCSKKQENCAGKILDLEISSSESKSILEFINQNNFVAITDTVQLLRFAKPEEISYYFQPSKLDPSKRKYTIMAKEGVINSTNYKWDIILRRDNDTDGESFLFWLKSYDNNRNQIEHLDFAYWKEGQSLASGRIDCDTTIHWILPNEQKIFKPNALGKLTLIETYNINDLK